MDVRAQIKEHAFGRALEDEAFAERLRSDGGKLSFVETGFGWFVLAGKKIICSGPAGSRALGVELFRRWTGKEVNHADL